ncbi:DcaP family trimeric outer membrane transporter [Solimonas flava]|uniref:DcaP family trimeric outer membrane transporter n=1 Tax=Solimonas flava TaxID=415849 RepID=UPI00040BCB16|nr:DcaP family trimeric outer membrane transporter [Solimonas flava]
MNKLGIAAAAGVLFAAHAAQAAETKFGDTNVTIGGYVKLDVLASRFSDGEVGQGTARDFYVPSAIPVSGGSGESHSTLDLHAKETRLFIKTDTPVEGHKLGTLIEFDFISGQISPTINNAASGAGNENTTNAYNPALRRAYITFDNWLFGQDWTTFINLGAIPETLDFVAFPSEGTVFARQPQVRYTKGGFAIALENPQTTVAGVGATDDNIVPDVTARYGFKLGSAELNVAAVLRQLKIDNAAVAGPPAVPARDDTAFGGGVSVSGKIPLGKDDIRFMLTGGDGIGRYVALGTATDAVLDGTDLSTVPVYAGYIAYRHPWTSQLRSSLAISGLSVDNDENLVNTATTTKTVYSAAVNLLYSPVKTLTLGAEFRHAHREVENGDDGNLDRLQFSAKYMF